MAALTVPLRMIVPPLFRFAFTFSTLGLEGFAVDGFAVDVFEFDRHVGAVVIDVDVAVELESAEG